MDKLYSKCEEIVKQIYNKPIDLTEIETTNLKSEISSLSQLLVEARLKQHSLPKKFFLLQSQLVSCYNKLNFHQRLSGKYYN